MLVRKRQCYLFISLLLSQNKDTTTAVRQSLEQAQKNGSIYFSPVYGCENTGAVSSLYLCCCPPGSCIPWKTWAMPFYYTAQGPQISDLHQKNSLHSWLWDRYYPENKILAEQLLTQSENLGWLQIATGRVLCLTQGLVAGPWLWPLSLLSPIYFILLFQTCPSISAPPALLSVNH